MPSDPSIQAVPDPPADAPSSADVADAVKALETTGQVDVAKAALYELPDSETANVAAAAIQALPPGARNDVIESLSPDQAMTNLIWRRIITTFSGVLAGAMLAIVAAVFVTVDPAALQILLTIFTTTAGILAGFISGRLATSAR